MKRFYLALAYSLLATTVSPNAAMAVCCYVDDPGHATCITSPIQSATQANGGELGGNACNHTIEGNNCHLQITETPVQVGGDCITIGRGVTVEGNGYEVECAASFCSGPAVEITNSGATSGTATIENFKISGCWSQGIEHISPTVASAATDVVLDFSTRRPLGVACAYPHYGITGVRNITRAEVFNADWGVELTSQNGDLTDSSIHDNVFGVYVEATGTKLVNSLVTQNDFNLTQGGSSKTDLQGAAVQLAGTCQCTVNKASTCAGITIADCTTFSGTRASFDDFEILY
ncbi:MAG TPA: hypothetical protein VN634_01455 [Candidatus Limnocylindrales bacterium]|nr:hypothetical protein [Candidatus Limnocylindrales bacterium]